MATKKKTTAKSKAKAPAKSRKSKAQVVKATATETPKTMIRAAAFESEATKVTQKDLVEAMALKREIRRIKEGRKSAQLTQKQASERLEKVLAKMKVSLDRAKSYARIRGIFREPASWEAQTAKSE